MATTFAAAGVDEGDALAWLLVDEFSSLPALLTASPERLAAIAGDQAARIITSLDDAIKHVLLYRAAERPLLGNIDAVVGYLHADMAGLERERFHVLHLDVKNHLLRAEMMSDGTIDETHVYVREVLRRALELGSASLILAHNHPSGDVTPSLSDIQITRAISSAGHSLGIAVLDHVIIGGSSHYSLRAHGQL